MLIALQIASTQDTRWPFPAVEARLAAHADTLPSPNDFVELPNGGTNGLTEFLDYVAGLKGA